MGEWGHVLYIYKIPVSICTFLLMCVYGLSFFFALFSFLMKLQQDYNCFRECLYRRFHHDVKTILRGNKNNK